MKVEPIKVMAVDDSAVVRQVMAALLGNDPTITFLGAFADPIFAQRAMAQQWPDVILLDVEMPRMDGITFLQQIMTTRPTPVIICSTLTTRGAAMTLDALEAGAFEIIEKPNTSVRDHLTAQKQRLITAIKAAAKANVKAIAKNIHSKNAGPENTTGGAAPDRRCLSESIPRAMSQTTERIVAIGTSTGGTQALETLLRQLPIHAPGIVIVQHMPEAYTKAFADRLNSLCKIRVKQADDGERVLPGTALIAPGGRHMQVVRQGAYYHVAIKDGPPVSRHRPSVNVLFGSVATSAGGNSIGIIMTGMGDDGARGILEMKQAGARTYAQDEASCVVFGMPKEAIKLNAIDEVVALDALHEVIMGRTKQKTARLQGAVT